MRREFEACTCISETQYRMWKDFSLCYKPWLVEEIEICAVGKMDIEEGSTALKEEIEHLDD